MTTLFFAGYNGFKQFKNCDELMMSEWTVDDMPDDVRGPIKFCSSWSVNVLAMSKQLLLSGCLKGAAGQTQKLTFSDEIKAISCNDSFCLILLANGNCYKFLFDSADLCELNFTGVDREGSLTATDIKSSADVIEHIACGHTFSVAVTNANVVYNIPSRIFEFPKHVKVKKLCCGAEHAVLLTTNGDVYSWGSSSRGQLGLGQLDSETTPVLIDALAGVKIVDLSAGLWNCAAVSAFGDLYMWGWNLNGQLGKPVYKNVKVNFHDGRSDMVRHKDASVFASPEIVDLPMRRADDADVEDEYRLDDQFFVERVHCGSRHTVIETKCGKVLGCGFNRYGQLGVCGEHNIDDNIVQFVEMNHSLTNANVKCGSWCTLLVSE